MPGGGLFTGILDDAVFMLRSWRHAKVFGLTSVLTIGLGLGLNAGIFSFADGFLFRPLPFDRADQLFRLGESGTITGALNLDDYDAIKATMPGLAGAATWEISGGAFGAVQVGDQWLTVLGYGVTPRFEQVLGFQLLQGRGFRDDEHRVLPTTPCWVSFEFWRGPLSGDPRILGRHLSLVQPDGRAKDFEVVGVLPAAIASFDFANEPPQIVTPANPDVFAMRSTGPARTFVTAAPIVRLADGMTADVVRARLQALVEGVQAEHPGEPKRTITMRSLREAQVRGGRQTAWLLFAIGLAILLLVTINLSHLLLARAIARNSEIAIRVALGASRWRIVRLFLLESVALSVCGLAIGLWLGWQFSAVIHAHVPTYPTGGRNLSMVPMSFDRRVGAFTALLAAATAILAGVWPAWRQSSGTAGRVARALARIRVGMTGRAARTILIAEVSLATVIMAGTALVGVSAWRFLNQPLGFDPAGHEQVGFSRPPSPPDAAANTALHANLRAALLAVPGVTGAAFTQGQSLQVIVDQHPLPRTAARAMRVDAAYFSTLGVRLLAGRPFEISEEMADAPVAIVDDTLAKRLWAGASPLGQRAADDSGKVRTVIGVVPHLRWRLTSETADTLYVPLDPKQFNLTAFVNFPSRSLDDAKVVLTRAMQPVLGSGRATVADLFEMLALRETGDSEFQGPIVAVLGAVAFFLTSIGLYGLVTYLVEQRIREFGVRLALGAGRIDLWRAVLRQSVVPAAIGIVVGLSVSLWTDHLLESLLFGVSPGSPSVLAAVGGSLLVAAVLASIRPARRVLRIDPVQVLRAE